MRRKWTRDERRYWGEKYGTPYICETCGVTFFGSRTRKRRFCSNKCFGVSVTVPKATIICKECGGEFEKRDRGTNEYCSLQCHQDSRRKYPKNAICANCGKVFKPKNSTVAKYCCITCVGKQHMKENHYRYNIEDRTRTCKYCGEQFVVCHVNSPEVYCSNDCYGAAHTRENHHHWNPESSRVRYPVAFNTHLRKHIRNRDNRTCQMCQKTEKENGKRLDVHHIDYNKLNNDTSNLISLCPVCHSRIHNRVNLWQEYFSKLARLNSDMIEFKDKEVI